MKERLTLSRKILLDIIVISNPIFVARNRGIYGVVEISDCMRQFE